MDRRAIRALATFALAACALAVAACDHAGIVSITRDARSRADPAGDGSRMPTVDCSAAIVDRVDPNWRNRSVVRGRFGLYGGATDIRTADRWGRSARWTKIPVIVDGRRPATLTVSARDRERVGLTYGPNAPSPATSTDGGRGLAEAPRSMRFVPCADGAPTAWPGGLVLADRNRVGFELRVDGRRSRSLTIPDRR